LSSNSDKFSNDVGSDLGKIPVSAELFDVQPISWGKMVQMVGSKIQEIEKVVENFLG
jgi:hypothetical protein